MDLKATKRPLRMSGMGGKRTLATATVALRASASYRLAMMDFLRRLRARWDIRRGSPYEQGWSSFEAGDIGSAVAVWTPLAQRGNASAMYGLGLIAEEQDHPGSPKDMQQSARWMKQAAERGLGVAYTALGRMYEIGDPFHQDLTEAARYYRDAAMAGEPYAQVCLGRLYERGDGVDKDVEEAFRWYRRAADQGASEALAMLRTRDESQPDASAS